MNRVLSYRRDHPGDRSSYGVSGVPGLVVIHHSLIAGFGTEGFAPPAVINVDFDLAEPKEDKRSAAAAERAAKAQERAMKAAERAQKAAERLAQFQAKAGKATPTEESQS
jgi:hypothetical protein